MSDENSPKSLELLMKIYDKIDASRLETSEKIDKCFESMESLKNEFQGHQLDTQRNFSMTSNLDVQQNSRLDTIDKNLAEHMDNNHILDKRLRKVENPYLFFKWLSALIAILGTGLEIWHLIGK